MAVCTWLGVQLTQEKHIFRDKSHRPPVVLTLNLSKALTWAAASFEPMRNRGVSRSHSPPAQVASSLGLHPVCGSALVTPAPLCRAVNRDGSSFIHACTGNELACPRLPRLAVSLEDSSAIFTQPPL